MKVFISRNLDDNSLFKSILTKEGYTVTGISLLTFFSIPFNSLPKVDWLFFYSKNGVKYFFDQKNYPFNQSTSIAAMGPSTAKAIGRYGYQVAFTGKGTPTKIANAFRDQVKGQKVAFLRASNSKKSIQTMLKGEIEVLDRVVYRNIPLTNCFLPPYDVLVFTSPANAQTYFKYNNSLAKQPIFSIGETTTTTLQNLGIQKVITAPNPTEIAIANVISAYFSRNSK